jgi:hypothetical protein
MKLEAKRLRKFYLDENPPSTMRPVVKKFLKDAWKFVTFQKKIRPNEFATPWETLYAQGAAWLIEKNKDKKVEFLS